MLCRVSWGPILSFREHVQDLIMLIRDRLQGFSACHGGIGL